MVALPGLAALALVRFRGSLANIVVSAFALSFAINYAIVTALVLCGFYTRATVVAIVLIELLCIALRHGAWGMGDADQASRQRSSHAPFPIPHALSGILAIGAIVWAAAKWTRTIGTPFQTWDAIQSWNRWARVFADGAMPADVQWYPQLIPANWSIAYVLTHSTAHEALAKAPMGWFFILTLIAIAAAGVQRRSAALLLATPLVALLDRKCVGEFLNDGYVDAPVAFFATASTILLLANDREETHLATLHVSCAIAAAAALTKQAGAYFFLVWPLLAIVIGGVKLRNAVRPWLVLLLAPLAFYATQFVAIQRGTNYSNIAYVTRDIFHGTPIPLRALAALRSLGIYVVIFAFALVFVPWQSRVARALLLAVGLPFTLIWACWFSYDRRNVALTLPFIAIAAADGASCFFAWTQRLIRSRQIDTRPATR